ncbi:YdaS family helix-turn-helix protein [Pseudomonas citronellolis]|uniref:YdaS family helix-turn-helix protein n=1 Tax=Pseudomonas citronellolis TaxID=53408 RepID=UPI0026494198|nr:YdaS family helix-turn-helix protein [Pseudomonas citronellolis]MDN6872925.1 YdaS family helix-turn-helix protein [Pseudomonas citronellolis]
MKLIDYIKPMTKEELDAFAARCGSTVGQLRQVAYGRRASADLAIRIDMASDGVVNCEDIRGDINWAYLRGRQRAA